jgi:hypothetical protein
MPSAVPEFIRDPDGIERVQQTSVLFQVYAAIAAVRF